MAYITVWPLRLRVAYTDKCYRLALTADQGYGWTAYTGNWVFPEARVGTLRVIDNKSRVAWIVFDARSGKPYLVANREGPAGSGIEKLFTDKTGSYSASEIPTRIIRKDIGKETLQHLNSTLTILPQDNKAAGTAGHDSLGFRNAQQLDASIRTGLTLDIEATHENVPLNGGKIAFNKKVESSSVQMEYRTAASEFKITDFSDVLLRKLLKGTPDEVYTQEQDYGSEFTGPLLWLSRGPNLIINRATGINAGGSILSGLTGPDGKTESAMMFGMLTGLTETIANIIGNFSIIFSFSNITATTEIMSGVLGNFRIRVVLIGADWYLEYRDAGGTQQQKITWTGTGWGCVKITRYGNSLRISENGTLLQTIGLPSVETIGGAIAVMPAQIGGLFDVSIFPSVISEGAIAYYYNELINNQGNSLLPLW